MAKYRVRFNDKARAGAVMKRNQLRSKRQKQFEVTTDNNETEPGDDAELAEKLRKHEAARPESDARKRVRMAIQYPERANSAKKKRLEKYIEKQVRKEEKEDLLRKLAQTQKCVESGSLKSLGTLGTGSKAGTMQKVSSFSNLESEDESEDENSDRNSDNSDQEDHFESFQTNTHSLLDLHSGEKKTLGSGVIGFKNLPSKNHVKPAKKPSWRERLGIPAAQIMLDDADNVSDGSSDYSDDTNIEESENDSEEVDEDGHEHDSDSENDDESETNGEIESKSSGTAFMEWAKSVSYDSSSINIPTPKPQNYVHTLRKTEGEQAAAAEDAILSTPGWFPRPELDPVVIERSDEVIEYRTHLPSIASEHQIMDAVNHFDVVLITGATGSGKTTQIPQFLFEGGYARKGVIGVTQPRRVAAISMAQRISTELCGSAKVDYQIRFDSKVDKSTAIKLMTDGILLKEMSSDLLLSKYSAIIIDEAHERSANTDILIGLLSRVVHLRRKRGEPLKLIIMSATLRVADFADNSRLFANKPPVINVESRQFNVTNHFSRRTSADYVAEAIRKARRIHENLPKGGILIFLTGKEEIQRAVQELDPNYKAKDVKVSAQASVVEEENVDFGLGWDSEGSFERESGNQAGLNDVDDESDLEMNKEEDPDFGEQHDESKLHVLPLYSLLSTEDQLRVFEPVPSGHRLCVVATNVAETSLTIPNIRYVIDCGRAKQRVYDIANGIQKFSVKWVSKASADQRAGRAGRTGPGHCYRLYSSAVFEHDFPQFSEPEIIRMPVEGLVLQMKSMGIHNITNFPFPTQVPEQSLSQGIRILQYLGALDSDEKITELGNQMSLLPLHPRHAKMLLIGNQHECLPFVVALVAALSVQDLCVGPCKSIPVLDSQADVLQYLSAIATYSWTPQTSLCHQLGLRPKAMIEVASLRSQLARLVAQTLKASAQNTLTEKLSKPLAVPTAIQLSVIKQIVAAAYIDKIAARQAMFDTTVKTSKLVSRQPYIITTTPGSVYQIHPDTILQTAPDFVVYHSLTTHDDSEHVRIRPLTAITVQQISALAAKTPLITYSKPLGGAYAPKVIDAKTREAWVVPRYGAAMGSGGLGWDLPPKKITQMRNGTQWVEK